MTTQLSPVIAARLEKTAIDNDAKALDARRATLDQNALEQQAQQYVAADPLTAFDPPRSTAAPRTDADSAEYAAAVAG